MDVLPSARELVAQTGRGPRRFRAAPARVWSAVLFVTSVLALLVLVLALLGAAGRRSGPVGQPPVPPDARATPLALPPAAPAGSGGYVFMQTEDDGSGRPVRWDPCRPIHYVIRPDGAPPGGDALIHQAVTRISALTGLQFVDDGATGEAPSENRATTDRTRYGNRWSPVLIAWTDPEEYPPMAEAAGRAGPTPVAGERPGQLHYVTGVVYLNGENLRDVANWNAGRAKIRGVILHELGHLVGLGHPEDPNQLMYDRQNVLNGDRVGQGDQRGFAALGDGPCFSGR